MLEELALGMQSQRPESEFGRPDARGVLITGAQFDLALADLIAKHRDELDAGRQRALADKWRRWLVRESGLIQEQQTDRFGFLHLSFLEYLAGQAALREQARMGHAAIARFVVERHGLPRWRETLLLMLGSRNDDRELGNAVVAELLAAERKWETGLFLLSLLREEIDIDPGLRTRVLEVAAESAIVQWSWAWGAARSRLADILRFGRKHGPPLRSWIEQGLASRRGEALVGLLVLLPETLEPTRAMIGRSDEDLGLAALLDLGPTERWGKWAIARATRATWWAWCRETPIAGIVHRAVVGFDHSEMWVASLLRRTAWISQVLRRAALELRGQAGGGGLGVPARIVWSEGSDRHAVVMPPAISTECEAAESRADFVRDFAGEFADGVVGNFEVDFEDALAPYLNENLARYFARYFAEDFARYFAEGFAEGFANVKIQREPNHGSRNAPVDSSNHDWPSNTPADRILSPLVLAQAAEAYAGLLLTPSGEPAARIAEARVQNHWLNLFLDPLVNYITRSSPLTPEQHALFLALGLAQFQTTWSWPSGPHWKSWFASDPPEHWLTAYVWHLCWAVGEPANPEHQVRARACLDRGDSPELVDELRKFPLIATPPEVLALFDGSGGA